MDFISRIHAASRHQAMDWSLVLLSQGIESKIEFSPENQIWWLEVAAEHEPAARETIRKYQHENRRWAWRKEVAYPGLLFDWAALSWVVLVVVFYWAASEVPFLQTAGAMDTAAVEHGQWWRLCTAVWLHADVAHLAGNATIGVVLLGFTLGLFGTGTGLLAAYIAGIGGNVIAWQVAGEHHRSLGASGLVMGCIGLLAAHTLFHTGRNRFKLLGVSAAGALMLFVLLGLSPGTDVIAHTGGAITGALTGALLALIRVKPESARHNLIAGAIFFLLTVIPWAWAVAVT
jgi:membrane associated rhomboid family serine protease